MDPLFQAVGTPSQGSIDAKGLGADTPMGKEDHGTSWESITLAANALRVAKRNGVVVYKTQRDMLADTRQHPGKVAWVLIDPQSNANTSYIWDGTRWQSTFDRLTFALGNGSGFQQEGGRLRAVSEKERDIVSVLDYATDSGGVPGQGADDTAAFVAAARACPNVYLPPGTYLIDAARLPRGTHIFGKSPVYYLSNSVGDRASIVRPFGNATALFSIEGNVTLEGIVAIGNGTGTLFSPATASRANHIKLYQCSVFKFSVGISGTTFPGYIGGFLAESCTFAENGIGIANIVDSCIIGGTINANTSHGIQLGPGANDNSIIGVKVEWNGGSNISLAKSINNVIVGGVIDRAVNSGIYVGPQAQCVINGVMLRRNGKSGIATDAHIALDYGAEATITGIKTREGADDGGKGTPSPFAAISLINGKASLLQISNSDLSGCTGSRPIVENFEPNVYWVSACRGVPDIRGQQRLPVISPSGSSEVVTFHLPSIEPLDARVIRLRFVARSTGAPLVLIGVLPITILREQGNAVAIINEPEYVSQANAFGSNPIATLQLSVSALAPDGSALTLRLTNNSKLSAFDLRVEQA